MRVARPQPWWHRLDPGRPPPQDRSIGDHPQRPGRPYCIIHARDDTVVGFENAERLHRAAAPPKRLVALESGGHLFPDRADADRVLAAALSWFDSTL